MTILERYLTMAVMAPEDGGGNSAPSAPAGAGSSSSPATAPSPSSGTSTPAPAEGGSASTTAPTTTPAAESAPEMDFDSIFGSGEKVDQAEVPPTIEVKPGAPGTPPQAQPQQPATPAPAPTASPQAPTSPAAPSGAAALDPADPIALAHAIRANEAAAIEHIAHAMFQLSREDVEGLETNVVEAVPKLLARSFVRSQQMMLEQMGRIVPQMMGRQIEALRRNAAGEGKFYTRWPQLRAQADLVKRLAVTYRQMNPGAQLDQMIEELGPIALMTAKLPLQHVPAPGNPMASAANGSNPPRGGQPTPFAPAIGGPGQSPQSGQEWSDIEAMFLSDR